jgi:hypothetical protein
MEGAVALALPDHRSDRLGWALRCSRAWLDALGASGVHAHRRTLHFTEEENSQSPATRNNSRASSSAPEDDNANAPNHAPPRVRHFAIASNFRLLKKLADKLCRSGVFGAPFESAERNGVSVRYQTEAYLPWR